jgi:transketolase N-terminal domain/subunit
MATATYQGGLQGHVTLDFYLQVVRMQSGSEGSGQRTCVGLGARTRILKARLNTQVC